MGLQQSLETVESCCQLTFGQPHCRIIGKETQSSMESLRGRQSSPVNFIHDPQYAVDFNLVCCCERPELAVAGQENAANVHFGECVSKAIMDRQPGTARDDLSRTENLLTRQVHNLQPALEQHPLFASREAEQFVLKECVRDENLIRQTQLSSATPQPCRVLRWKNSTGI